MQEREKSQAVSYGGLRCSHLLQWIYVLALTGLTLYQFIELQNIKEEVAILKEVRRCGFFLSLSHCDPFKVHGYSIMFLRHFLKGKQLSPPHVCFLGQ